MMTDIHELRRYLPQRYPFLLVDRAFTGQPGNSMHAIKAVTANEYCYRNMRESDDFAYPVSLMVEALSQSAGMLLQYKWPKLLHGDNVVIFGGFSRIRIDSRVYPGDLLQLHSHLDVVTDSAAVISGYIEVNGQRVLTAERITAALRPFSMLLRSEGS